jgi:hypothetical protein
MANLNLDCLRLIFSILQTDKRSLYYCLLVNKEWCRVIVPILWRKHSWHFNHGKLETKFLRMILTHLPSSSRKLLSDNGVKLSSEIIFKPLSFNYVSFCKYIEADTIEKIISMGFDLETFGERNLFIRKLLKQELYKLFVSQCKNVQVLTWRHSQPLSLLPGASTCFHRLRNLSIQTDYVTSDALYEMSKICKSLNIITIYEYCKDNYGLISLIDAQSNLKEVSIFPNIQRETIKKEACKELIKALERKCDTITNLRLSTLNIIPPSFLTKLIKLKIDDIDYGGYDDHMEDEIKVFQQYFAVSEFPDLQVLDIKELTCFKEMATLIGKTKGDILKISIGLLYKDAENTGMLIKAIAKHCPKIKTLSTYIESKDFIHVKSLLLNCKNLTSIVFDSLNNDVNKNGDELLNILAKFSPKSLIEISISGFWKYSTGAFERLFESFRDRTLECFKIIHLNQANANITGIHKMIVSQYIVEGIILDSNCVITDFPDLTDDDD